MLVLKHFMKKLMSTLKASLASVEQLFSVSGKIFRLSCRVKDVPHTYTASNRALHVTFLAYSAGKSR